MRADLAGYVAISSGMALAGSCFAMLGGLLAGGNVRWVLVAIVLAGGFCALVSASMGELAALFPSAPGIRTYLRAAFGNWCSLATLFLYLAMVALAAGVEGSVATTVVQMVVPQLSALVIAPCLFLVVIVANAAGLEVPRTFQLGVTTLLIAAILAVGVHALVAGPALPAGALPLAPAPDPGGLAAAVGTAVFLFIGFEWVTPMGRGPAAYQRQIPLSMLLAIGLLVLVYALFGAALDRQLGPALLAGNPAPQVTLGGLLYGSAGRGVLAAVSLLAMLSSFNAGLMGASRLIYGLAREGVAPAWIAAIDPRTGVPVRAIAAVGSLCFAMALVVIGTASYRIIGVTVAAIECLVYCILMLATLRLRRIRGQSRRPFRTPLSAGLQYLTAALFPLLALGALTSLPAAGSTPLLLISALATGACVLALLSLPRRAGAPTSVPGDLR